jgi:hypothetical protein
MMSQMEKTAFKACSERTGYFLATGI